MAKTRLQYTFFWPGELLNLYTTLWKNRREKSETCVPESPLILPPKWSPARITFIASNDCAKAHWERHGTLDQWRKMKRWVGGKGIQEVKKGRQLGEKVAPMKYGKRRGGKKSNKPAWQRLIREEWLGDIITHMRGDDGGAIGEKALVSDMIKRGCVRRMKGRKKKTNFCWKTLHQIPLCVKSFLRCAFLIHIIGFLFVSYDCGSVCFAPHLLVF